MLVYSEVPGIFGNRKLALPPPPLFFFLLCLPSAARLPRRRTSCHTARGSHLPTRCPRARPPTPLLPAGFPRARHAAAQAASSSLPSPPWLIAAAAPPAPFSTQLASTRRLQAIRRPSFPLLVLFRARHAALPLPELHPAAMMRRRSPAAATARRATS
jgi:hypothetical protein